MNGEVRNFVNNCPRCRHHGDCSTCRRREPRGKLNAVDWLGDLPGQDHDKVVEVMFKNTRVGFFNNEIGLPLKIGDLVVVEAAPGHDVGRVNMTGYLVRLQMKKASLKEDQELKRVLRIATEEDLETFREAKSKEHSTMIKARSIAEELGLSMKIGDVEYQGDGGKAIFYYIADERVDFRKLIRVLADTFKVRIEMRQIGARQEAGRIGGIGPCGRTLCCSSWMNRFVSVSTAAARIQDISMNPQKLAGQCGKLKCCLNFEIDAYSESQKKLPPKDVVLESIDNDFYLFKTDILSGKLTYSTDKHLPVNLVTIDASRAFDIINLNRKGIKVESLSEEDDEKAPVEFGDIIGQDSVTRFDRKNKKKKKNRQNNERSAEQKDVSSENLKPEENKDQSGMKKPHHGNRPEKRKFENNHHRKQRPNQNQPQES